MKAFPPGKSFESDPFMVGDTSMAIEVFPNGSCDENKGNVGIFLVNKLNQLKKWATNSKLPF